MKLRVISTGSIGNFYILDSGFDKLLIECGVHIDAIKKALGYYYHNVSGCLLTHEHQDHAKSVNEIMKLGIDVFATKGTFEKVANETRSYRKNVIKSKETFHVGRFTIMPFDVKHDAAEPVGFLIHHPDCGKVLFLTDTYYCEYTFTGLNNIIIEANYSMDIINEKYGADSNKEFLRNRILKSHFSLENCVKMLQANDLSQTNNIVLIHLSDTNSNEVQFKKTVQEATNKNITVASNNIEINLSKTPF